MKSAVYKANSSGPKIKPSSMPEVTEQLWSVNYLEYLFGGGSNDSKLSIT